MRKSTLHKLAATSSVEEIVFFLEKNSDVDVNTLDAQSGKFAIYEAACAGNLEVVKYLFVNYLHVTQRRVRSLRYE